MAKNKSELCDAGSKKTKNTGSSGVECIEKPLERIMVARTGFRFATFADAKDKSIWLAAIAAKDIVPLYKAYAVASANVAEKKFESGTFSVVTEEAIKKTKFESYLSLCSHSALKSYGGSDYTQVIEFNKDDSIALVYDTDGVKIKGQDLTEFKVGIRNIATDDKVAFSEVEMTYEDYNQLEDNFCLIKPNWNGKDLQGIFDVDLEVVSFTATTINVKATLECSGTAVKSFTTPNFAVKNATGVDQVVTALLGSNDIYTLTGTGFVAGYTVGLNGVVTVASVNTSYEDTGAVPLV